MKLRSSKLEFTYDVLIESLSDVPRLQGFIQCKLRLLASGGTLYKRLKDEKKVITGRTKIENHQAQFNSHHQFVVPMTTNSKAVLKSQIMRVSVRLFDNSNAQKKLGYSDIDLAELSPGENIRKPLLTGYRSNKKERQDNSRIILKITMSLTRGDPLSFLSAGCDYNSYPGTRNVIKEILNPPIAATTSANSNSNTNHHSHLEPSTLHSQLAPSECGGHHSRNASSNVDCLSNSFPMSEHWNLNNNSSLSRNASQERNSFPLPNINSLCTSSSITRPYSLGPISGGGGGGGGGLACNSLSYSALTAPLPSGDRGASSINLSTTDAHSTVEVSTAAVAAIDQPIGSLRIKRLPDHWDSLAPSRLDNEALVNSLFENFAIQN